MGELAPSNVPAPFIVGVSRSGTTLLRLMLDAHPEMAIPAETHFLIDLLVPEAERWSAEQFFRALTQAPTWPNFALEAAAFREALDHHEKFSLAGGVREFYRLYAARSGKFRWGDKTPPYRNYMLGIERLLPEARFIHIIRDGRDVALSYRGLWFGPGDDIEVQARFWVDQIHAIRNQSQGLPHYLEIQYETLVQDPERVLHMVGNYLGLPYHPRMMAYYRWAGDRLAEYKRPFGPPGKTPLDLNRFMSIHDRTKGPPDVGRIGRWRTHLSAEEQRRYEAIAGDLLSELGYETR